MILPLVVFYIFAAILVISSLMVISARNPVHSVLFLILAFFNVAGLFLLQGAEFLAMILVIVYVGAVAILFLFVIMMLNISLEETLFKMKSHFLFGVAIAVILSTEIWLAIRISILNDSIGNRIAMKNAVLAIKNDITNTHAIGNVLYTNFIYQFQISAIILLIAMVGAVVITHRKRSEVKKQNISEQISRNKENSMKLVKVLSRKGV